MPTAATAITARHLRMRQTIMREKPSHGRPPSISVTATLASSLRVGMLSFIARPICAQKMNHAETAGVFERFEGHVVSVAKLRLIESRISPSDSGRRFPIRSQGGTVVSCGGKVGKTGDMYIARSALNKRG
jgi:hypothetical protein